MFPGSDVELRTLFADHREPLARYARHVVGDGGADDAAQYAVLSVWRRRHLIENRKQCLTLLKDAVRSWHRHDRRRRQRQADDEVDAFAARDESPEDCAVAWDLGAAFARVLPELTDVQREVAYLRIVQELSVEETAELLGLSEKSVATRLSEARRILRSKLKSWLGDDGADEVHSSETEGRQAGRQAGRVTRRPTFATTRYLLSA